MASSNAVAYPTTIPRPKVGPRRTIQSRNEITQMESSRIRSRHAFEDLRELIDFEWAFTSDEFEAFKTWYEDSLLNGAYPFTISYLDPDDSNFLIENDYSFFQATYQFAYSDNVYLVAATCIIEEELIEQIVEPFNADSCAVVLWPNVSDGLGGGNTFDCYDVGDYTTAEFEPAGTNIGAVMYKGNSPFAAQGEDFEGFSVGPLVLGSSFSPYLDVMYYGDSPLAAMGDWFEDYSVGTLTEEGPGDSTTGIDNFYVG